MGRIFLVLATSVAILNVSSADAPSLSAKQALQPFNDLIGSWKCTGTPAGSREEQQKNFWTETLAIEWQFKGPDAWLKLDFKNGKYYQAGELRYRPGTKDYELKLVGKDKETRAFAGPLTKTGQSSTLALERKEGEQVQRLVFSLLHANRFLYRYETRPATKTLATRVWSIGATKEGESFAVGAGGPECIVSGGKGTIAVTYQGKTYYVCCSGCRSEFQENPQKYIAEYEAKKAKKQK